MLKPIYLLLSGILCLTFANALFAQNPTASQSQAAQGSRYVRPGNDVRARRYFMSMFGPTALGIRVARAGISTW
ncbi:MAG TPA: hypothetical protein VL501_00960, partial [Pyrinomonadaceae bacterium]|nr:hypothetical protein [Pyrinomonadaceae bacterium]